MYKKILVSLKALHCLRVRYSYQQLFASVIRISSRVVNLNALSTFSIQFSAATHISYPHE